MQGNSLRRSITEPRQLLEVLLELFEGGSHHFVRVWSFEFGVWELKFHRTKDDPVDENPKLQTPNPKLQTVSLEESGHLKCARNLLHLGLVVFFRLLRCILYRREDGIGHELRIFLQELGFERQGQN